MKQLDVDVSPPAFLWDPHLNLAKNGQNLLKMSDLWDFFSSSDMAENPCRDSWTKEYSECRLTYFLICSTAVHTITPCSVIRVLTPWTGAGECALPVLGDRSACCGRAPRDYVGRVEEKSQSHLIWTLQSHFMLNFLGQSHFKSCLITPPHGRTDATRPCGGIISPASRSINAPSFNLLICLGNIIK